MSTLRQAVQDYIEMRRMGFKLRETERGLIDFVTFLEANNTPYITTALALAWAQRPSHAQPSHWATRLGYVRDLPVIGLPLIREPRFPQTVCYPFARSEHGLISIQRKISGASCPQRLRCRADIPIAKLRPWTYYCLFGLLSVSGLRLGEARNLKLSDIDFDSAVLTIRGTKFGKSRLVPMHASTSTVLQDYLKRRRQIVQPRRRLLICSLPKWATALMRETFIEHSILCLARSACAAQLTVTARACMTCDMCSQRTP